MGTVVRVVDLTPRGAELGDAAGNVRAALALVAAHAPQRAARLRRTVDEVRVVDSGTPVRCYGRALWVSREFALDFPAEAVAIGLVVGLTEQRLGAGTRHAGLDARAQVRRRERLEALDFAAHLPNALRWQGWVREWLTVGTLESEEQQRARVAGDLRRNNVPEPLIRLLLAGSRALGTLRALRRRLSRSRPAT